jgi:hypothetical protein
MSGMAARYHSPLLRVGYSYVVGRVSFLPFAGTFQIRALIQAVVRFVVDAVFPNLLHRIPTRL